MLLYPEVQAKAHREIDHVVGDRYPTTEDRDQLPYLNAVWKETLRWAPPVPLGTPILCYGVSQFTVNSLSGVPHVNTQNSEYNGYHIPKGSYLHANIGCILRDPEVYDSPSVFNPDRFLNEATPEPAVAFGYGHRYILRSLLMKPSLLGPHRVCPGNVLSDHIILYVLLNVLWAFRIDVFPGELRPKPDELKFMDSAIRHVQRFLTVFDIA